MKISYGHYFFAFLVLKRKSFVLLLLEVMTSEIGGVMMTENQRMMIAVYREKGMSYKEIADALSVSINTIKTFCKRNGLGGVRSLIETSAGKVTACEYCGNPVVQNSGRKKKRFCSDKCRNVWWNTHQEEVNKKANYECVCTYCSKHFISYGNKNRKYCSHVCYTKDRFGGVY